MPNFRSNNFPSTTIQVDVVVASFVLLKILIQVIYFKPDFVINDSLILNALAGRSEKMPNFLSNSFPSTTIHVDVVVASFVLLKILIQVIYYKTDLLANDSLILNA